MRFQGSLDWRLMDEILAPSRSVGVRSSSSTTYQLKKRRQNCMLSEQLQGRIVIGLADNSADPSPKDQGSHQMFCHKWTPLRDGDTGHDPNERAPRLIHGDVASIGLED